MNLTYETMLLRCALSPDPETRASVESVLDAVDFRLDPKVARILDHALEYHKETGGPLTVDTAPEEYRAIIASLDQIVDPNAPFWAMNQLRKADRDTRWAGTLVKSMEILKIGDGPRIGLQASIDNLLANMPSLVEVGPEEDHDLASEYEMRVNKDTSRGISTGFSVLDELTDGQEPGELWVVGAYTAQGKSYFMQNVAYNRRMAGLTGVLVSTEQPVAQIKRRMVVRHALHPKFGSPDGLSYTNVKRGRLSGSDHDLYINEVIPDWNSDNYPPLFLLTAPAGSTFDNINRRIEEINRQVQLDYIIIDYLSMLRPSTRYTNERETQTRLFIAAKTVALNFDAQRGIPLLTAAQTNPMSFERALEQGKYYIRSVADTAEAERSSDLLMYILRRPEDKENNELQAGILKYRDGESDVYFTFEENFDKSLVTDKTVIDSEESVWTPEV